MPSKKEKKFFIRAFGLIDNQNGTEWQNCYKDLQSQSPNGEIDWGNIPGLFNTTQYKGTGYKKGVNRVIEILVGYVVTKTDPDSQLLEQLKEIALLAKGIHTLRQKALEFHGGNDIESGDADAGHITACRVWEEASEALFLALEAAFAKEKIQQQNLFDISTQDPVIPNSCRMHIEQQASVSEVTIVQVESDLRQPQEFITTDQYEMNRTKKIIFVLVGVAAAVVVIGLSIWFLV